MVDPALRVCFIIYLFIQETCWSSSCTKLKKRTKDSVLSHKNHYKNLYTVWSSGSVSEYQFLIHILHSGWPKFVWVRLCPLPHKLFQEAFQLNFIPFYVSTEHSSLFEVIVFKSANRGLYWELLPKLVPVLILRFITIYKQYKIKKNNIRPWLESQNIKKSSLFTLRKM